MTPAPASEEQQAETRRRIVETAHDHFLRTGFSAVTMDDLARELGMSKKTVYEHFPTKVDLLRETKRMSHAACEREFATIAAEEKDFFARARRTFAYVSRLYSRLTPAYMTDIRRNAPEVWDEIQRFRRERVRRNIIDLLRQGVAQGVLRKDLDVEDLARLYLTMTSALLNPEISGWAPGEPITPLFETFIRVYFEGLITPAGRKATEKAPR